MTVHIVETDLNQHSMQINVQNSIVLISVLLATEYFEAFLDQEINLLMTNVPII